MKSFNQARGLVHKKVSLEHFDLLSFTPSTDLSEFIETYWIITWDLCGKAPYIQENLPHPSQHMVIDPQAETGVFGIQEGKFAYKLENAGRIFGIKFWPGAFYSFLGQSVSTLTNKSVPISNVFSIQDDQLEVELKKAHPITDMALMIEGVLRQKNPELSTKATQARKVVQYIEENKDVCSVNAVAETFNQSQRTLQRLFDRYIGVSPKWVIERYRMIEAIENLNQGMDVSLTHLSHQLGYFDQAHFSKAFNALIGFPPSHYHFS